MNLRNEPVAVAAGARIAIAAAGAFGLDLTVEQVVTVITVIEVVIAWWTRRRVTPTAA